MAHLALSAATLRIAGDDLDPEEVTALLGAQPSDAQRKGQQLPSKSAVRIAKTGLWRLSAADTQPENVDAQVQEILGQLTQDLEVWRVLSERFEVDLFCGWFMNESNEGVTISKGTLRALADRGVELALDIYGPASDA